MDRILSSRNVVRIAIAVATIVAMASIGGALLFAYPVLLPLHVWAIRDLSSGWAAGWIGISGLAAAEWGWQLAYGVQGESGALIWTLPMVCAAAVIVMLLLTRHSRNVGSAESGKSS